MQFQGSIACDRVSPNVSGFIKLLFLSTPAVTCSGIAISKTITIDRLYQANGTVINRQPIVQ